MRGHYLLATVLLILSSSALAGNQQYEVLETQTRSLMSKMVSDEPPKLSSFDSVTEENYWILAMDSHLSRFVSDSDDRKTILKTIHYEATRAGLEPELVLGLVQVESGFKKYAISSVGARGYMQVMPFWTKQIGNDSTNLFYMRTNLRFGCTILRHYLDIEHGNMFRALGRYNGSLGQASYPNAVLGAMSQFKNNIYAREYEKQYLTKN